MNRQTKRLLQKQGQVGDDGQPVAQRRAPTATKPRPEAKEPLPERVADYVREVRNEMAKVAWPPRSELIRYSTVVFCTLIVVVVFIYYLNQLFEHTVLKLYT